MSYKVELSKSARKFLSTLSTTNYQLVIKHLLELEQNPHPFGSIKLSNSDYLSSSCGQLQNYL